MLQSERLRITFAPAAGDRIGHLVESRVGGRWRLLLQSLEGTPEEPWPASPPFQQAHLEQRGGSRQVVLLVGMAGSSHWSASVEIDPAAHAATFDVACRLRGQADWLGSRYRMLAESTHREPGRLLLAPGDDSQRSTPALGLELSAGGDPANLVLSEQTASIELGAIEAAQARTIRWCYRVWAGRNA